MIPFLVSERHGPLGRFGQIRNRVINSARRHCLQPRQQFLADMSAADLHMAEAEGPNGVDVAVP
jgi:hypothetical protein